MPGIRESENLIWADTGHLSTGANETLFHLFKVISRLQDSRMSEWLLFGPQKTLLAFRLVQHYCSGLDTVSQRDKSSRA